MAAGMEDTLALATAAKESYYILIPCYAFILLFALWGHKQGAVTSKF